MPQAEPLIRNLKFGVFEADLRTGELTKLGRRVRLQEQPFQLLAMLLEKPGVVVTREELQLKLWPQTTVDFDHGVNKAISKIREALGDSAENPRFIETVARRGYRFLADVTVVDSEKTEIAASDLAVQQEDSGPVSLGDAGTPPRRKLHYSNWRLFGMVPVLILSLSWIFLPWKHPPPTIHSIVVLPLQNLSNDPSQDYFANSMTDEIITNLTQVKRLRVISLSLSTGYQDPHRPPAEIARKLHVDAMVKGSVLFSGDHVRINARLIEMPTERDIWAQSYEGDIHDTLKLQSQIAQVIAQQLRVILDRQEQAPLSRAVAQDPHAYQANLR
jgi:TolB-like protein/DNA-binding winged helix-turn-helix (wHTH) protein